MADAEDRRYGIDGEDHVGRLNGDQDQGERSRRELPVVPDEESAALVVRDHRSDSLKGADHRVSLRIEIGFSLLEDLDPREYEKRSKEVQHPMESLDKGGAHENENKAQAKGAENAPEEYSVMQTLGDRKIRKDENENEDVIHAERVFNEIARKKLQALLGAELEIDADPERDRQCHPGRAPEKRLFEPDRVRLPVKDAQVY